MITFKTYRNGNVCKENEENANDTHLQCQRITYVKPCSQHLYTSLRRITGRTDHHLVGRHSWLFTKFRFRRSQAPHLVHQFNLHWTYTSSRCTGLQQKHQYHKLAPVAQDLLAAPASQAYIERIFSVCGLLTAGRRNRMNISTEMLKANLALKLDLCFCSAVC